MNLQRDINISDDASEPEGRGRNLIAVIGIDHYRHWQRLTNAVSDARGAAALFMQLGFSLAAKPLINEDATGRAIQSLVTDDLVTLGTEDSLVLFYAGHGGNRKHDVAGRAITTGYLIPVDAGEKASTWIDLEGWLRAVALLPANHILVIVDACYSGIALDPIIKWRDTTSWHDEPLSTLRARRSRRIITSALDDQCVMDSGPYPGHSLFTGCLIEALTRGLRQSGRLITTGSELGLYIQRRVEAYPHSKQTPDFGTFAFDDRGEMVISMARQASQVVGVAAQGGAAPTNRPIPLMDPSSQSTARSTNPMPIALVLLAGLVAVVSLVWAVLDKQGPISPGGAVVAPRESTVLWVDDHPDNNVHERQSLESMGVRFVLARSNAEALEKATLQQPDVIISDMERPEDLVAGYALLESLRQLKKPIPAVIYSDSCSPERRAEAGRLGALGCTGSPHELFDYVRTALRAKLPAGSGDNR